MNPNPKDAQETEKPVPAELDPSVLDQVVGGIKGESTDKDHKDWISFSSFA